MLPPELPLMKRKTFGKLHFSNSSTVYPYFGSMCMPVAKMCTSNSGGSASSVRIKDFILPKSARVPERKTILRGGLGPSLATDIAPGEQRVRCDVARCRAPQYLLVAGRQDLAGAGPLYPQVIAGEPFARRDARRGDHGGISEVDGRLLFGQDVLGSAERLEHG